MNYWLGLDKLFFSLLRLLLRWMTRAATVPNPSPTWASTRTSR